MEGGGVLGPGDGGSAKEIQVKAYCEVAKLAKLFQGFDDAKRRLVRSVGFDGLLKTPFIDELDDIFSMWLMTCLDPKTMIFSLPNGETLPIRDVDAHFVLGIPFRGKDVCHDTRTDKDVVSNILGKLSIGGHAASLTLEYLEWIIGKQYGEKFQEEEKVAFQIAVVLYSMAAFLAGPVPKKGFPIWLLKNFVGPTQIHEYNWCGYVLSVLAHGTMQVHDQLKKGDDFIKLHGCTLLLQVFYLDNLDFGSSSSVHLDIPRAKAYNTKYLKHLIGMDRKKALDNDFVEYGRNKLRDGVEVCYSRGWEGPSFGKWGEYAENYVTPSELFHNIILYDDKLAGMIAGSLAKISASQCYDIRKSYRSWYPDYTTIFSGLQPGTFLRTNDCQLEEVGGEYCNKRLGEESTNIDSSSLKRARVDLSPQQLSITVPDTTSTSDLVQDKSALYLLAEEASKDNDAEVSKSDADHIKIFVFEDGFEKKLVTGHSMFPKSPFELDRFMHTITWRKKMALLDWLEPEAEDWGHLTRVWVHIDYPAPISLMGYHLKTQLSAHGSFTGSMVDAITRSSSQYDEIAYGAKGARWRHFLPARFAEVVLREEDFLSSIEIKAHFTGEHIGYAVENCRLFTAPVYYHGRWSCYFWDFQKKQVTVLDPTRMGLSPVNVEMQHGDLVDKLTKALFACIERFFSGWDFDSRKWREFYPTHHGPRSKIYNSGLYSILYSRYFDGQQLVCTPNQGGLIEPRSALLYALLTIRGNQGKLPARFQDIVSKPWLKKR